MNTLDTALLAAIFTLIGVLVKAVLDAIPAFYKTKTDSKVVTVNADSAFRDDLLSMVDKYEAREARLLVNLEKRDIQVEALQQAVAKLLDENAQLRSEKRVFQYDALEKERDIATLRKELEKFERKVFYVRQTDTTSGDSKE